MTDSLVLGCSVYFNHMTFDQSPEKTPVPSAIKRVEDMGLQELEDYEGELIRANKSLNEFRENEMKATIPNLGTLSEIDKKIAKNNEDLNKATEEIKNINIKITVDAVVRDLPNSKSA